MLTYNESIHDDAYKALLGMDDTLTRMNRQLSRILFCLLVLSFLSGAIAGLLAALLLAG